VDYLFWTTSLLNSYLARIRVRVRRRRRLLVLVRHLQVRRPPGDSDGHGQHGGRAQQREGGGAEIRGHGGVAQEERVQATHGVHTCDWWVGSGWDLFGWMNEEPHVRGCSGHRTWPKAEGRGAQGRVRAKVRSTPHSSHAPIAVTAAATTSAVSTLHAAAAAAARPTACSALSPPLRRQSSE